MVGYNHHHDVSRDTSLWVRSDGHVHPFCGSSTTHLRLSRCVPSQRYSRPPSRCVLLKGTNRKRIPIWRDNPPTTKLGRSNFTLNTASTRPPTTAEITWPQPPPSLPFTTKAIATSNRHIEPAVALVCSCHQSHLLLIGELKHDYYLLSSVSWFMIMYHVSMAAVAATRERNCHSNNYEFRLYKSVRFSPFCHGLTVATAFSMHKQSNFVWEGLDVEAGSVEHNN